MSVGIMEIMSHVKTMEHGMILILICLFETDYSAVYQRSRTRVFSVLAIYGLCPCMPFRPIRIC
jgi:hypothetical protein